MVLKYPRSHLGAIMEVATIATATAAASFLAGGLGRIALAGWQRASTRLHQYRFQGRLQTELRLQTERARMAGQAHWQSTQSAASPWRVMQVVEIADESHDVRSFYLQDPLLVSALPSYRAGQFLIVRPALGGADLPARCYSLSDAPGQDWFRISVKRQSTSTSQQYSLSNWLHDHIRVGDCLLTSGPHGDFVVDETLPNDTPIALLCAGVGVTPILSMLKSLLMANPTRAVSVFCQVQDIEHWPFGDLIHSWGNQCPSLNAVTYFSRLAPDQLPTVASGLVQAGRADSATIYQTLPEPGLTHYYMCGPDAWMKSHEANLQQLGVPGNQIHWESFASNAAAENADESIGDWELQFVRSGITIPQNNKPTTILQAAAEQGLNLPAACHSGVCGTCKLKLLKGAVKYARQPACSHQTDEVVACVAQAIGSVELDA